MLMQASGDVVTKAGDTFIVHMDQEALNDYPLSLQDVTVEIVTFDPDQEIAWTVHGRLDLGYVYGYAGNGERQFREGVTRVQQRHRGLLIRAGRGVPRSCR
jgi:hypothetical protein